MKELKLIIKSNKQIAEGIYKMILYSPELLPAIVPGQFVNLEVPCRELPLRRPFGICEYTKNTITICYQIAGNGTEALKNAKKKTELSATLPLGNGFNLNGYRRIAVVGGGVGIFPLVSVLANSKDRKFYSYIGFKSRSHMSYIGPFVKNSREIRVGTDDGSFGDKATAVRLFIDEYEKVQPELIIACGPIAMLRTLKKEMAEKKITTPALVSMEERMGCGIGACLVCICTKTGGKDNFRICKDGPVFNIADIEL